MNEHNVSKNELIKDVVPIKETFDTTKQVILKTTEDKLRLLIQNCSKRVDQKKEWRTPAGICGSWLIAITSSTPKSALGLPANVWQAFYFIIFLITLIWTGVTIKNAFNKADFDDIISGLKNNV